MQRRSVLLVEEDLAGALAGAPVQDSRRLCWSMKTEAWLTVQPLKVNGTEMGVQGFQDALFLRYGLEPPDLPKYCDICNFYFSIRHALDCNRVGLVTARHNELRDWVSDLSEKSFTPTRVRNDPLIFSGCAVKRK